MNVRVFHNVAYDSGGRPLGMLDGYRPGDPVVLVAELDVDAADPLRACDVAYELFNVGDDPEFYDEPDPRAVEYRKRGNRSLSVGDVVQVDGQTYACAIVGWTEEDPPRIVTTAPEGTPTAVLHR